MWLFFLSRKFWDLLFIPGTLIFYYGVPCFKLLFIYCILGSYCQPENAWISILKILFGNLSLLFTLIGGERIGRWADGLCQEMHWAWSMAALRLNPSILGLGFSISLVFVGIRSHLLGSHAFVWWWIVLAVIMIKSGTVLERYQGVYWLEPRNIVL